MAAKKSSEGATSAAEQAAANATGARPGRVPPVIEQAPVTAQPIKVTPEPAPKQTTTAEGFPKIKRVIFHEPIAFTHNTHPTREINLEYLEAAKVWKAVEFCEYFGALTIRLLRVNPTNPNDQRVYRIPFAQCACVETWDDNPVSQRAKISVNEHVVEVPQ